MPLARIFLLQVAGIQLYLTLILRKETTLAYNECEGKAWRQSDFKDKWYQRLPLPVTISTSLPMLSPCFPLQLNLLCEPKDTAMLLYGKQARFSHGERDSESEDLQRGTHILSSFSRIPTYVLQNQNL